MTLTRLCQNSGLGFLFGSDLALPIAALRFAVAHFLVPTRPRIGVEA
jgi:hypothetical protein